MTASSCKPKSASFDQAAAVKHLAEDPSLPQLRLLLDPENAKALLPYSNLSTDTIGPDGVTRVLIEPIRYHPLDRCTIRYRLHFDAAAQPESLDVVAKVFSDSRGVHVATVSTLLWEWSQTQAKTFRVARPLGYSPAIRTVWSHALDGSPVLQHVTQSTCAQWGDRIGQRLAAFHTSAIPLPAGRTALQLWEEAKAKGTALAAALPSARTKFQRLLDSMALPDAWARHDGQVPTHGTFRISELISCSNTLGIYDLDDCVLGDPAKDLAAFVVDLHFHDLDCELVQALSTAFLCSYQAGTREDIPVDRFIWHMRVRLLEKAHWVFLHRRSHPRFEKRMARLVSLLEAPPCVAQGAHTQP
jgi:hypothetical protein